MTINSPSNILESIKALSIGQLVAASSDFELNDPLVESGNALRDLPPDCMNDYHIALVPRKGADQLWEQNVQHDRGENRVLLLPLTWNKLVTLIVAQIDGACARLRTPIAHFGEIRIEFSSMEVMRAGRLVGLTAMEFNVLRFFVFHRNRVISRDELLNKVWGYDNYPCTRTVDNHVLRLRQKLEPDPAHPVHFRTVHGVGYKFVA